MKRAPCLPWNRMLFIEGIGRVHALGPDKTGSYHVAALDVPNIWDQGGSACRAADIVHGSAPGRILWAIRMPDGLSACSTSGGPPR